MSPMTIVPEDKDWTWVLTTACPECGFDAAALDLADLPQRLRDDAEGWVGVLARADAATRPTPTVWSPLEYACHVRDAHRVFDERVGLMLAQDDPQFANWDQDRTAVEERYDQQDPATVAGELVSAATAVAATYAAVAGAQWQRSGRRSNGSAFTVGTIGRYHLHDVVHHSWDVGAGWAGEGHG